MTGTLVAKDLAGGHGHRVLFESLDLTVAPGDVVGVVGANGAGKSTLLRLLAAESAPLAVWASRKVVLASAYSDDETLKRMTNEDFAKVMGSQDTKEGLTLAREILGAHGFGFLLRSEEDGWTRFEVRFGSSHS